MTIKAIETVYNGYRFRSRLEARWAVFFDALGIQYEYELEGFDLGELGWYLPDFYLPEYRWYLEIKPTTLAEEEKNKVIAFTSDPPEGIRGVVPLVGTPDYPELIWAQADDGSKALIGYEGATGAFLLLLAYTQATSGDGSTPTSLPFDRDMLNVAICAARQARFEHGEQPVTAAMLEAV